MRVGLPHRHTQRPPRGALQLPFLTKAAEGRMMTIGRKTIEARGLVGTAEHEMIRHRGMRMGLPHRLTQKHPRGALQLPFLPKAAESRFMTIGSKRIRARRLESFCCQWS